MSMDQDREPGPQEKGEFHYSRSRRLARAGEEVRWLESRRGAKGPGLVGSLVATPATRILFASILVLLLLSLLVPYLDARLGLREGRFEGLIWEADALYFEERVLVVVRTRTEASSQSRRSSAPGEADQTPPISLRLSLPGGASLSSLIPPLPLGAREFRYALAAPEDRPGSLQLRLSSGEKELELRIPVK